MGGAVGAAFVYRLVRPDDFTSQEMNGYPIASRLLSEYLGTFFFVLTVGLNVLGGSPAAAFSIAAALMCMTYALGTISGAHFNPAVTAAIVLSGREKIRYKDAGAYVVCQLLGGIGGSFMYALMEKRRSFGLGPVGEFGWMAAGIAETMFTFVLCFVVLCVTTTRTTESTSLSQYFGFAIGMCYTVGGYAIGGVSGGSLNPALSIAISSSHLLNHGKFFPCLAYMLFELVGAAMAAGLFRYGTHRGEPEYQKSADLPATQ
eukprot:gnl/TRDRNA2_/TRDRNA2_87826_c0_seq1.p1 gnl/TRDRNA2_/TRDRNA2_87826_c0~~gnl/TRDRNA2_/TRDRNA2_87826_c0_seq1.p1  ORF type:complete len:290 (+),score=52.16 gnl/TRDRNA2_/TRDRNA2_87826_c0_seq1:91-870(+)